MGLTSNTEAGRLSYRVLFGDRYKYQQGTEKEKTGEGDFSQSAEPVTLYQLPK